MPVNRCTSCACTVSMKLPAAVGVPLSNPLLLKVRPAGKLPLFTVKTYGATPPLPVSCWLYAVAAVPAGKLTGVTVIVGAAMVTV